MNLLPLIQKKRDGQVLSEAELQAFVHAYAQGKVPDYQVAALLMAIYFRGMELEETVALTHAMATSGGAVALDAIRGTVVDKHSTGGVGDKTSLVLIPLVAAAGVKVAKLSGRGLGHSGGTLDKLESFPGFQVEMEQEAFVKQVNELGFALAGQSRELVPADKQLYALRDVTATVDCLPLIASSIMSKKLVSGAQALVLDVKTGHGSFNPSLERALELARLLVRIGQHSQRHTVAFITDMDQPLGLKVGNTLEVKEALDCLRGEGPEDLRELCLVLGTQMVSMAQPEREEAGIREELEGLLDGGEALARFRAFVARQGGDARYVDEPDRFPTSTCQVEYLAPRDGYLTAVQAGTVGTVAMQVGAGRSHKEDVIDLRAGIELFHKAGEEVSAGDVLARVYGEDRELMHQSMEVLATAFQLADHPQAERPLVLAKITPEEEFHYLR